MALQYHSSDDIDASNLPYFIYVSLQPHQGALQDQPRWMAIRWLRSLCSLALRILAMGLPSCARCRAIPLDLFLEQDFVHELCPSITVLKSSAEAGCHTCLIFSKSFISPPGPPVKRDSSGPVLLRRCVESNRGPPLDIRCGSMVGFISCCVESGLSVGKCSYQEWYSPHA